MKTVTTKQFYDFVKNTNMMGYIDSEAALIRMIKRMTEGKSATAVYFEFLGFDGKKQTFKIDLKNLEN